MNSSSPSDTKRPLPFSALAILLSVLASAILSSCASAPPVATGVPDSTVYLPGYQVPQRTESGPVDSVSYWDGDGISGTPAVTLDLSMQRAFFFKGDKLVGVSRISSGDGEHRTPTGNFKITQKSAGHRSNLYGDYVDSAGNVIMRDIGVNTDARPPGTTFRGAPMTNFMRFNGAIGMHAGFLPGYAASHGCVRMPEKMSEVFFRNVSHGTTVRVVD